MTASRSPAPLRVRLAAAFLVVLLSGCGNAPEVPELEPEGATPKEAAPFLTDAGAGAHAFRAAFAAGAGRARVVVLISPT